MKSFGNFFGVQPKERGYFRNNSADAGVGGSPIQQAVSELRKTDTFKTDNAAMIAFVGGYKYLNGQIDDFYLDVGL